MHNDITGLQLNKLNEEIRTILDLIENADELVKENFQNILKNKMQVKEQLATKSIQKPIENIQKPDESIHTEGAMVANLIHNAIMNCLRLTLFHSKTIKKAIKDMKIAGFTMIEIEAMSNYSKTFTNKIEKEKNEQKRKVLIKYENIGKWIVEAVKSENSENIYKLDYTWIMTEDDSEKGLSFKFCCDWRGLDPIFFRKRIREFTKLSTDKIISVIQLVDQYCPNENEFNKKYQFIFPDIFPKEEDELEAYCA